MTLTAELYRIVRAILVERGHGDDYTWSQAVQAPATPEDLVREYAWVVLNSGMRHTVARQLMDRVWPRLVASMPIGDVFGHRGKVAAIESAWRYRAQHFQSFFVASKLGASTVLEWGDALPWIGPITKWHLAKNLGVDCAKPDRWLVRLAEAEGGTVETLCARLARETGDRVATVDVVLWRACAIGVLEVDGNEIKLRA